MITYSRLGQYGRLGNQLWQIASTIGIATNNQQEYIFPNWEYQDFFDKKLPYTNGHSFIDYNETWGFEMPSLMKNLSYDLYGYFQDYRYFSHCKELVKSYLNPTVEVNDQAKDMVAIHVRRGDYLNLSHIHPNLTMNYYRRAMEYFPGREFLVFSDDIDWCIQNFKGGEYTFVIDREFGPVMNLLFMSKCAGFILANSSFSWWAAYLSGSNNVVAPKTWAFNETFNGRILPEWKAIDNEN